MKKILIVALCLISANLFAQNEKYTVESKLGYTVEAIDLFSSKIEVQRQIQIIKNGQIWDTFILSLKSTNGEELISSLKSKTFSGVFSVSYGKDIILLGTSVKGAANKLEKFTPKNLIGGDSKTALAKCTVKTVHDCVAFEIDDMNWIEYGLCVASAPACYSGLWASCTWEVCHNGNTYVNPNK